MPDNCTDYADIRSSLTERINNDSRVARARRRTREVIRYEDRGATNKVSDNVESADAMRYKSVSDSAHVYTFV